MFMKNVDKELFIKICRESETMAIAAAKLKMHFSTFKRYASMFGCYLPNQGAKGTRKKSNLHRTIDLKEITDGKHPSYQTFKLKLRLLKAGLIKNQCSICDISEWCNKTLNCELDHINGNRTDHRLENLRMLCPNCHSQTDTYRSKNIK